MISESLLFKSSINIQFSSVPRQTFSLPRRAESAPQNSPNAENRRICTAKYTARILLIYIFSDSSAFLFLRMILNELRQRLPEQRACVNGLGQRIAVAAEFQQQRAGGYVHIVSAAAKIDGLHQPFVQVL